jgi:GTP cyclohydrolase I
MTQYSDAAGLDRNEGCVDAPASNAQLPNSQLPNSQFPNSQFPNSLPPAEIEGVGIEADGMTNLEDSKSDMGGRPFDHERVERAVREILFAVGEDPDREGLKETPARVARMYAELFSGLFEDPREHLQKFFAEKYDEVVVVKDISFCSMCEHHMLPFMGKCHIGYMPDGKVIGLSKLARVVEVVSHRPQVQERMTETIADLLVSELGAKGVAVIVEATHSCMSIRGVRKPGSLCVTSAMKGTFRSNLSSRSEIMQLVYGSG